MDQSKVDPRIPQLLKDRIAIYNIPTEITKDALVEYFKGWAVQEDDVTYVVTKDEKGRQESKCFVKFPSIDNGIDFMKSIDKNTGKFILNGTALKP